MPPRFTHDCDRCRFIGQHGDFDIYVCARPADSVLGPTLLARYGDDGPEYASMDASVMRYNLAHLQAHRADVPSTDALLVGLARFSGRGAVEG